MDWENGKANMIERAMNKMEWENGRRVGNWEELMEIDAK
jgi:hypothetical protein